MAGLKYNGWTNGGRVELMASIMVMVLIIVADVIVLWDHLEGPSLPELVLLTLLAMNIVGFAVTIHLGRLSGARKGFWIRTYPLAEATVVDAVIGYFGGRRMRLRNVGEKNIYTDGFSDVFRCKDPMIEVRLRPVRLFGKGVSIHVGPMDLADEDVLYSFLDDFDDFVEKDLLEGLPSGKGGHEEE
jgi:uncharacterized membrane protein